MKHFEETFALYDMMRAVPLADLVRLTAGADVAVLGDFAAELADRLNEDGARASAWSEDDLTRFIGTGVKPPVAGERRFDGYVICLDPRFSNRMLDDLSFVSRIAYAPCRGIVFPTWKCAGITCVCRDRPGVPRSCHNRSAIALDVVHFERRNWRGDRRLPSPAQYRGDDWLHARDA